MTAGADPTGAAAQLLVRLIELTEREATLIAALDAEGLERLCDERAPLLSALGRAPLPPGLELALHRFATLRDANLRAATGQRDELRRRLGELGTGRSALTAYLPAGAAPSSGVEREG